MKIYSWNVLYQNKRFDEALSFLVELDFDVVALQEVPEHFLDKLKELPFHIAISNDWKSADPSVGTIHLVMLSRHPILEQRAVSFPDEWYAKPWPLVGKIVRKILKWKHFNSRTALIATIKTPNGEHVQIASSHLVMMHLNVRIKEFNKIVMEAKPHMPLIICGDFNILEWPHVTLINWFSGAGFLDFLYWKRERNRYEKLWNEIGFLNPLKGMITHRFASSQLDHILVPDQIPVMSARVIKEKYGSDHNPVTVQLKIDEQKGSKYESVHNEDK